MEIIEQIVDFDKYCNKCKHFMESPVEDPCDECLSHPVNEYTNKPVKFEENEK